MIQIQRFSIEDHSEMSFSFVFFCFVFQKTLASPSVKEIMDVEMRVMRVQKGAGTCWVNFTAVLHYHSSHTSKQLYSHGRSPSGSMEQVLVLQQAFNTKSITAPMGTSQRGQERHRRKVQCSGEKIG